MNIAIRSVLLLGLVVVGASAHAQGGYVSAYVGSSTADDGVFAERDTSFRVGVGYRVNPNLAVEFSFADYGKPSGVELGIPLTLDTSATIFQVVGIAPITPYMEFYGKIGIAMWSMDGCIPAGCVTDDGTDLAMGLGMSFALNPNTSVHIEYETATFDYLGVDVDMTTWMVGMSFRF
jgi:predicted porin